MLAANFLQDLLFSELFVTLAPALKNGTEKRNPWNGNAEDDLTRAILIRMNHSFPSFKKCVYLH